MDCYLGAPDSNPKPPGPKAHILPFVESRDFVGCLCGEGGLRKGVGRSQKVRKCHGNKNGGPLWTTKEAGG